MTKQEAIKTLREWRELMADHGVPDFGEKYKALGMAIEALQTEVVRRRKRNMDKTKAKYKPGDRVRVRVDLTSGGRYSMANGHYDIAVSAMTDLAGKIVTIKGVSTHGYTIEEDMFNWTDEMFEPTQPIVIYHNGDKVIALDKNTGKKGVAKCSPDDRFDFCVGAKLAFDRLMEQSPGFKVGDLVVGLPEADNWYRITCSGWKGLVVQVSEHRIQVEGIDTDGHIRQFDVEPKYFRKIEEEKHG